ncbi:MAG: caspase family protein, partial [Saprospiraceae bacterium]|nr:caspase family protein [Saprospiraceae bacterium]
MAVQQIFALLIGINEYGQAPLKGCVNDVQRIADYLKTLPSKAYRADIATLLNGEAIKTRIVGKIKDQLGKASAGDIALLYFSGHGVQEEAPTWLSKYEHDNKIECVVCYDQGEEDFLLADKEMRYVFNQAVRDPDVRVITIFDCCHSGDNMRAFLGGHTPRRIPRTFPERGFDKFIFAHEFTEEQLEQDLNTLLPVRHDLHISACRAYQQAFEDKELHQGIFTDFLFKLLEARNSNVRYIDIRQIAKMRFSSRHDKQIPEVTVRRKGNLSLYDGWLGRTLDTDRLAIRADHVSAETGWVINAGQMHGLKDGDEVQ